MGYSCTADAMDTLGQLNEKIKARFKTSNMFTINGVNYFYEIGREQPSGAITGSLWKTHGDMMADKQPAYRAGTFKINADGTWARKPIPMKKMLEMRV